MRRIGRNPHCAVNVALEIVGDPWTLLVVRDIVFYGAHTYSEFLRADEGVTTSVLADRLALLLEQGILTKERSSEDRRKEVYALTEKGLDLIPVLVALGHWGAQHGPEVTAYPSWFREADRHPERIHALVRTTVAEGRAAFRGADSALSRLGERATLVPGAALALSDEHDRDQTSSLGRIRTSERRSTSADKRR